MTNLHFEYRDTISINALTLMCYDPNLRFDIHQRGIVLHQFFDELIDLQKTSWKFDGKKLPKESQPAPSEDSILGKVYTMTSEEESLAEMLFTIREKIKLAINKKELCMDEYESIDCSEVRLNFNSAQDWKEENYNTGEKVIYEKPWNANKNNSVMLILAALLKKNNLTVNFRTSDEIANLLMNSGIELDPKTIENHLKESKKIHSAKSKLD